MIIILTGLKDDEGTYAARQIRNQTQENVYTATTHTARIHGARFRSVTVLRRTGQPKRKG